jgi:hypothetical protein
MIYTIVMCIFVKLILLNMYNSAESMFLVDCVQYLFSFHAERLRKPFEIKIKYDVLMRFPFVTRSRYKEKPAI